MNQLSFEPNLHRGLVCRGLGRCDPRRAAGERTLTDGSRRRGEGGAARQKSEDMRGQDLKVSVFDVQIATELLTATTECRVDARETNRKIWEGEVVPKREEIGDTAK